MKKKITALLLVVALVAVAVAGSTMAYFTDTDQAVNVTTVGNVKIEMHEYERATDADGNFIMGVKDKDFVSNYGITESYKLQPFTQGKPAYPAVYTNENGTEAWDEFQQLWNQIGAPGSNDIFDDSVKNVIDKFVFVENTGKSDAYYRTWIAIECPETLNTSLVHLNLSTNNRFEWNGKDEFIYIDGSRYLLKVATYTVPLEPGEVSRPSFLQYFLDPKAENEDVESLGDTWEVLVWTEAVQTAGFDSAKQALDTAFGTGHPWDKTSVVDTDNQTELLAALAAGKDVYVSTDLVAVTDDFNGDGATVNLLGVGNGSYGYLAFAPGKGKDTSVENLKVTGSGFVELGHYGEGGGAYEANALTVENMVATLCINNGGNDIAAAFSHYGTATLTDCVMTGTTALKEGYAAYDAAFVNGTKTTIDGGKYGNVYLAHQAKVTITGAEIESITSCAITTRNLGKLTIGADAKIGTIYLTPGSYSPALVIEDGATVDAIVYNGETFTQAQWLTAHPNP